MDPNQSIVGKKGLSKAMPDLYGPNYNSTNFTPLFNNIRTGALMSKPHHCTYNDTQGHKMTRRCVSEGHQGYCVEFVDAVMDDGEVRRVRCGQRLKVESGGCGTHPANTVASSKNLLIKNLVAGKVDSIMWDQLNNTKHPGKESESQTVPMAKQLIKAQEDEKLAELDEEQDTVEDLPANPAAYQVHIAFVEHKKAKDRSIAEERKANAAVKRSSVLGKMKQAATNLKTAFTDEPENPLDTKRRQGKSYKSQHKNRKPDPETFKNKRGGKHAGDLDTAGQENHAPARK